MKIVHTTTVSKNGPGSTDGRGVGGESSRQFSGQIIAKKVKNTRDKNNDAKTRLPMRINIL